MRAPPAKRTPPELRFWTVADWPLKKTEAGIVDSRSAGWRMASAEFFGATCADRSELLKVTERASRRRESRVERCFCMARIIELCVIRRF